MKIKRFNEMFNEKNLIYMSFDIDDNLLYMPTLIYMDHLVDGNWITEPVDTEKFAKIRSDKLNWRFKSGEGGEESFEEFRDWGRHGNDTFLHQFKQAVLEKRFAPSWTKFIECLVNGYVFSIVTSRGHAPDNVRRAIEWLIYDYGIDRFSYMKMKNVNKSERLEDQMIENLLSYHELFGTEPDCVVEQYLDSCPIYTISSVYFKNKFGKLPAEEAKKVALNDFTKIVHQYADKLGVTATLGFSDDDPKFVKSAVDQFTELMKTNKNIRYTVFDTSDRKIKRIDL